MGEKPVIDDSLRPAAAKSNQYTLFTRTFCNNSFRKGQTMSTQFPGVHSVQVYDEDADLIGVLGNTVATSLALGDSALIIATPEHHQQLTKELTALRIDLAVCEREGRYVALDAREVINAVMRNGLPDRELFETQFGAAMDAARSNARNLKRGLTVYGECVALLWLDGNKEAALRLEQLFEEVYGSDYTFHVHCGYPRSLFANASEIVKVEQLHSHVLQ